ncbi:MAG: UDP-galactopyranose mutase [Gammaproteobacteria bacterium]|nr:UDP-galactopyranose mutase [Gammaproteobacteria bacterium]MBU1654623.1 UDP-galactopyranose mutase [Gammaproteobacteria bacterium]MBU1959953.1 UDP-galactopyranose mutase [Gammaproteobacteria bacterium]
MKYDFLIVGAGFAGCVCARQLAENDKTVLLIDRRDHIGGNAYDTHDAQGVLIHPYGPHIFHTNAKRIFVYLSRFTNWRFYEHRVLAKVGDQWLPIPINRTTINRLYGLSLDEQGIADYLEAHREPHDPIRTSEDVVLNSVGRDLCDKFFRGYTRKQWGLELSQLSAGVAARIPVRTNDDDRYFTDTYQFMPAEGYSRMFERMLDHGNIEIRLGLDFADAREQETYAHTVYTGPIDAFYGFRFGQLPYRSLHFEHQHLPDVSRYQPVGTVNYPNDHDYTRITEFRHLTGECGAGTSIVREYPRAEGDPYYPVLRPENNALFKRYEALSQAERTVTFVGRLAQYKYYNMDQVVAAALNMVGGLISQ